MEVKLEGKNYKLDREKSLADFLEDIDKEKKYLAALVNDRMVDLNTILKDGDNISLISRYSDLGRKIYTSSISLLFILASKEVLGDDSKALIEYSVGDGIYVSLEGKSLKNQAIKEISQKMEDLAGENIKIERETVSAKVAKTLFLAEGYDEKVELLESLGLENVDIYLVKGKVFSFNSLLVPSTSYLKEFRLLPYYPGLVILYPTVENLKRMDFNEQADIVKVNSTSRKWTELIDVRFAGRLNKLCQEGKLDRLIRINETYYNNQIHLCSRRIVDADIRIILIAGPSSSGKTTTARKLANQMAVFGKDAYVISTDDYYVDRVKTPLNDKGEYDFESIYAIDLKRLNDDLLALLEGEEIYLPSYDFISGKSKKSDRKIRLNENNLVIVEGIHSLNPLLTQKIPDKNKYKIYVSALTQVNIDSQNRISSSDARLIRRIVRDSNFRGYTAEENLAMWENVRKGEKENIFPYQENADFYLDSSLVYEFNALKLDAVKRLEEVEIGSKYYYKAMELKRLLDNFVGLKNFDAIPNDSIMREFIGDKK